MSYGKQYPGQQTPTVPPSKKGATKVAPSLQGLSETRYSELLKLFGGRPA